GPGRHGPALRAAGVVAGRLRATHLTEALTAQKRWDPSAAPRVAPESAARPGSWSTPAPADRLRRPRRSVPDVAANRRGPRETGDMPPPRRAHWLPPRAPGPRPGPPPSPPPPRGSAARPACRVLPAARGTAIRSRANPNPRTSRTARAARQSRLATD